MSAGLKSLDRGLETTNIWMSDLMQELGWDDRERAYHGLRAVLHALRDRLSIGEAAQLGAQLPMMIRGLFYESWRPAGKPDRASTWETFMKPVYLAACQDGSFTPEEIVSAVFEVLSRHVSSGEIDDVIRQLPRDIRSLWPDQARATLR